MQQAEAAARTTAGSSLTSHVCRLSAVRIRLSPSLRQKSTYDERYPPFIPLSFVFCLCGVEGWRVLPQVEDATAAASLVGLTGGEKGEVGAGAAAATCGCRTCLHYSAPPLLQRRRDWGVRIPFFINHPPSSGGCIQDSLSPCGEQDQFRVLSLENTKQRMALAARGFTATVTSTLIL